MEFISGLNLINFRITLCKRSLIFTKISSLSMLRVRCCCFCTLWQNSHFCWILCCDYFFVSGYASVVVDLRNLFTHFLKKMTVPSMIFTMQDKPSPVVQKKGPQIFVSSRCWEVIANANLYIYVLKKSARQGLDILCFYQIQSWF